MCARSTKSKLRKLSSEASFETKTIVSFVSSFTGRELTVNVSSTFSVHLGGKPRKISIEAVAGVENVGFKHAGQVIVFEVPSAYSSPI